MKVFTWNILITLPRNVQVPNEPTPNFTAIAITIAVTTFVVHPLYRVNIWGYFNPIPINRVNNAISNINRLTYKCHTFLETSGQDLPIWPHKGLIKGGNFNPTPIDRVNKSISNNIRLTYKCHTLLETSGQGLPIYQHIRLILGGYLTPHTYRVNKHGMVLQQYEKSHDSEVRW